MFDLIKQHIIRQDGKNGKRDGSLTLQGYAAAGREFKRLMNLSYYTLRKHIVVIFHAKEEKDGENTKLRILVEGQAKNDIWQSMELGGFMEMQGDRRTIGFTNCERYFAKGTYGIKGIIPIPELNGKKQNRFLTDLFEKVQENIKEETEIFEKQQMEYRKLMNSFDFENTNINELMIQIANAEHVLTSEKELKAKFRKKITDEGYIWDKELKKYVLDNSVIIE